MSDTDSAVPSWPWQSRSLAGVLIGDELGQLKRLDVSSKPKVTNITTQSVDGIDGIDGVHPSKAVASIWSLDSESKHCLDFVIGHKNNSLSLYNCVSNHLQPIRVGVNNESLLVSAQPVNANNVVLCYENGSVIMKNIDKELVQSNEGKKNAMKLLGLDLFHSDSVVESTDKRNVSKSVQCSNGKDVLTPRSCKPSSKPSKLVNSESSITASCTTILNPSYNTSNTYLTSSKVCNDMIAIAGMNVDLKVLDLNTKQTIFTAKPLSNDWLGLKQQTWISGVEWVGGNSKSNESPSWVATCSRSDSVIRIYDIKSKHRKPVVNINLKDQTFNNDSNPPSFTSICSTSVPHTIAKPTQNLIVGTTIGRMLALDLRFNTHSYRLQGVFKGFGGGAVRDIKYIASNHNSFKILSCSLDRFVRIHNFKTCASSARNLESKVYLKTRPTCLHPIWTSFPLGGNVTITDDEMDDSGSDLD